MAAHDDGVQTIAATVTTAGRARDVSSVDIDREIPSTGPASLPAGGGLTAATGSLTLEDPGHAVEVRRGSPWFRDRGWPPALGDPVAVDVTVDGEPSRRFTGIVEDATGATGEPVEVAIVDPIDQLHRMYGSEAIATPMVHGGEMVDPWLRHEHHVTTALRQAGFWTTPRPRDGAALYVPLQGSVIPGDGGVLQRCVTGQAGSWHATPWGLGLRNVSARWITSTAPPAAEWDLIVYVAPLATGSKTQIVLWQHPQDADPADVREVGRLWLSRTTTTNLRVEVSWDGQVTPSATVTVPYRPEQPWVRLNRVEPTNGPATIWHGEEVIWQANASGLNWQDEGITHVELRGASSAAIGPIYLAASDRNDRTVAAADLTTEPNAVLAASPVLTGRLTATPFIERRDTLDLLRDIAAATLSDMWLDPQGRFHWAGVGALISRPPVTTLTATADLLDLAWEETTANLAHQVTVECRSPAVKAAANGSILLYQANIETLESDGDSSTVWASPEGDTDWINPKNPVRIGAGGGGGEVATPTESLIGGVTEDGGQNQASTWASNTYLLTSWTRINSQTFRIEHTARNIDSIGREVVLRTVTRSNQPAMSEVGLPRIVGHGRIDWTTIVHTAARTGPEHAADYTLEAGPWIQGDDCQVLADWIADWVTAPGAILRELPIIYRPDLELGQVVDVIEDAVYHIRVRAVVVGLSEHHEAGSSEMTVTLRVLALDQQPATLATYDQVWAGGTLAQRDQEWSGQSLAEFDANPLRRN